MQGNNKVSWVSYWNTCLKARLFQGIYITPCFKSMWRQTKITSSFTGLNLIPAITLRFKCRAFPPEIPERNLNMNGPVSAGYSCPASCEWHCKEVALLELPCVKSCSTKSSQTVWEISAPLLLDFHLLRILCLVVTAAHGASPAGSWWTFRNKIKLVFVFWSL